MPLRYFGFVLAASLVGQILVLSHVGSVERLLGSKRGLLVGGGIVTGAAFLVLGWTHSLWVAVPAIIVAFSFGLTRLPLFNSYMNKYIPSDKRATVLSTSSMVRTLGTFLSMGTLGLILSQWPIRNIAFGVGACLITLSVFSRVEEGHLKD